MAERRARGEWEGERTKLGGVVAAARRSFCNPTLHGNKFQMSTREEIQKEALKGAVQCFEKKVTIIMENALWASRAFFYSSDDFTPCSSYIIKIISIFFLLWGQERPRSLPLRKK